MRHLAISLILAFIIQVAPAIDPECENITNIIGYAVVSFDSNTVLPFFAQPNSSKQPVQLIRFYNDSAVNSLRFRAEGNKTYSLLRPEMHHLDYSIFELPVRSKRNGWLEVIVDQQKWITLWVEETQTVRFVNWLSRMQQAFSVERKSPQTNPLRFRSTGDAKEVELKGRDCFKVTQMQGNWIRVVQQDYCEQDSSSSASGWIKWRDERGCLLISIHPFA